MVGRGRACPMPPETRHTEKQPGSASGRPCPVPGGAARICTQDSVTIAPEQGAKDYQSLVHGSAEWARVYFNLRNSVEGVDGFAKDPAVASLE